MKNRFAGIAQALADFNAQQHQNFSPFFDKAIKALANLPSKPTIHDLLSIKRAILELRAKLNTDRLPGI